MLLKSGHTGRAIAMWVLAALADVGLRPTDLTLGCPDGASNGLKALRQMHVTYDPDDQSGSGDSDDALTLTCFDRARRGLAGPGSDDDDGGAKAIGGGGADDALGGDPMETNYSNGAGDGDGVAEDDADGDADGGDDGDDDGGDAEDGDADGGEDDEYDDDLKKLALFADGGGDEDYGNY
jgi:hypothetical protein